MAEDKLPSQDVHKRTSFLQRPSETMTKRTSAKSVGSFYSLGCPIEGGAGQDTLVTPFAQLLSSLRNIRSNVMRLTNIPMSVNDRRKSVNPAIILAAAASKAMSELERREVAEDTVEEVNWCLDMLEHMQSTRNFGGMAVQKFRQMLSNELQQSDNTAADKGTAAFITQTFLEHQECDLEAEEARRSTYVTQEVVDTRASKPSARTKQAVAPTPPVRPRSISFRTAGPEIKNMVVTNAMTSQQPQETRPEKVHKYGVSVVNERALGKSLENLSRWGADIFHIAKIANNRPLTAIVFTILQQETRLISKLQLQPKVLLSYLSQVEDHYRPACPYHNSMHGADVAQTVHCLLLLPTLQNMFTDTELFCAILAASIHDVGHPGYNNQFLINSCDSLALLYNDTSVLENHHCEVAFRIMQKEGCNVLEAFGRKKYNGVRRLIIDLVISTDMSKHMDHVASLRTRVEMEALTPSGDEDGKLVLTSNADRVQLLQQLLHIGDLSNPSKPIHIYREWASRVMEEFFRQGDRERALGLDVSPMCDRNTVKVANAQVGFIDYVVYPLYETFAKLLHPDCDKLMEILEQNRHIMVEQSKQPQQSMRR